MWRRRDNGAEEPFGDAPVVLTLEEIGGQAKSGKAIWDASSVDVRSRFPTHRDSLRIVQYDSCRGLEGWTVINHAFDDLWTYKNQQWLSSPQEPGGLFDTPEEQASAFASRWAMIPLTPRDGYFSDKYIGSAEPCVGCASATL